MSSVAQHCAKGDNVRNSVLSLAGKLRQSKTKRDTKLRCVGRSHVACLLIVFCRRRLAMPSSRHENVRHATLLFCALGGQAFVDESAEERE